MISYEEREYMSGVVSDRMRDVEGREESVDKRVVGVIVIRPL